MNPANFRHRITFQQRISPEEKTENRFPVKGWQDVVAVWAMNKTVNGREYSQAATTQNERTVRWIIRYRTGLSEDMRIVFQDGEITRFFEIDAILSDDERKKTLTVVCKEAR
ncbi:phage head closure protein [Bacillaceae bacterium Marseille-Q3522]|nr:phage head closure protein [Bacillaceae bacterium Marseille-Q3522]